MHTFRFPELVHIQNLDEVNRAKSGSSNRVYYDNFIQRVADYNNMVTRTIRRLRPIKSILDDIGRKILSEEIPDITNESLCIYDRTLGHIRFLMHNEDIHPYSYERPPLEFSICEHTTNNMFIIKTHDGYSLRNVEIELKKYHDYIKEYRATVLSK